MTNTNNNSWCPHCAHFRPQYNAFAKKMMEIAERDKISLDVYAVSCVPHRPLCQDQDIKGYPKIRLFIGDDGTEDEFIEIDTENLHPFFILQTISKKTGTDAYADFAIMGEKEEQYSHGEKNDLSASGLGNDSFWIHRTKYDVYCDAYLSFYFAMQHGIFVGRDPPDEKAKTAFEEWIYLLNEVLPPSWPLQAMLSDIVDNIETVLDSEANLLGIVDRYPPPRKNWSQSCSRGDSTMGYTCGLWQLFHITAGMFIILSSLQRFFVRILDTFIYSLTKLSIALLENSRSSRIEPQQCSWNRRFVLYT
jgi:thiol-disulfide isomerase/thioredoxin